MLRVGVAAPTVETKTSDIIGNSNRSIEMIRTSLVEKERFLAQRKAELGIEGRDYVAINSGARRTPAKRELLQTIQDEAQAQGRNPPFHAAF
jgi:hypothetical protein